MKTATVQARIEPKLKKDVEAILAKIGLSASEAISMYYSSIKLHKGIPFEAKVPNKGLRKAMRDAELGRNLHSAKNAADMMNQILGKR
ncbi:MAG: type II toxin-antitoxin system RelB/DinJ family antitoxin [Alphaproteobacteria bacterium]